MIFRKFGAFALLTAASLTACKTPNLTVSPGNATLVAGTGTQTITATLTDASGPISWTISPNMGTLSSTSGATVTYTPPATVTSATNVMLTASAAGLNATAAIMVNPPTVTSPPPQPVTPPPTVTGTLALNIVAPYGVSSFNANVSVTGPNAFSQIVPTTQTLTLPEGLYTITANNVVKSGTSVDTVYTGFISGTSNANNTTRSVLNGTPATTSIGYSTVLSTGHLWLVTSQAQAFGYSDDVLTNNSGGTVGTENAAVGNSNLQAIAFDRVGNVWVADFDNNELREYSADSPTSLIQTITSDGTSLASPDGLAFDSSGNLWVANYGGAGNKRIVKYNKASLDSNAGGALTPNKTIDSVPSVSYGQIAFDSAGNLWAAAYIGNKILKFPAASLEANPAPTVTISSRNLGGTEISLSNPNGVTFDSSGNLWVACTGDGSVQKLSPVPTADSSPTPALKLNGIPSAGDAAFDKAGNLWVSGFGNVSQFTPAQLANTGSVNVPANKLFTIPGGGTGFGLAFSPAAASLPIFKIVHKK
jgi:sugar lactone lactonase YvrE